MEVDYHAAQRGVRMATAVLVPLSEYLESSYSPDCEWVKGELRERSVPQLSHASVQIFFSVKS